MKKLALGVMLFLLLKPLLAQHNYANALHLTTRFLGAQRCGASDSWLHGNCHLADGQTVGRDLTGGWHDCGDHIKFSHTAPFTAAILLLNYVEYSAAYADQYSPAFSAPPANGKPDILDEIKYETDFLIKSLYNNTVYYQVGNETDHNSFSEPVYQSEFLPVSEGGNPRQVYSITSGASNICGESCAALALMSMAYSGFDAAYSTLCLDKAVAYYNIGKISPHAIASASNNGAVFYPADNWADDMAFAALALYKATNSAIYLNEAIAFRNNADFYVEDWYPMTYLNVNPLVNLELYQETGNATYLTAFEDHLDEMYFFQTNCGYMHFADWGSLNYASNEAYLALKYHRMTGDTDAFNFGKANIDFVLGTHTNTDNSISNHFSFLIGYNQLSGGYPQHPHHAAAFGYGEDAWDMFTDEENNPGSVPYEHELTGAVVGGPSSTCGDYDDNIGDYVSNEVCTYYNAGAINALALMVPGGAVPVELIGLRAFWNGKAVQLNWETASEQQCDRFEVQRMRPDGSWHTIFNKTLSQSTAGASYSCTDTEAAVGVNYYRLIQVDHDGARHYSSIVNALAPAPGQGLNFGYHPVSQEVWIALPDYSSDVAVGLYDICGRLCQSWEFQSPGPIQKMDVSRLPAGVLIMTVQAGQQVWSGRIVRP